MHGSGLKAHIATTLALLLGTAMLLANVIIVFLWQQNMIQSEADRLLTALQMSAQDSQSDPSGLKNQSSTHILKQLADILDPECLTIQQSDRSKPAAIGTCTQSRKLDAALSRTIRSGTPVTGTIGSTWAVFSLQPEFLLVTVPIRNGASVGAMGIVSPLQPLYGTLRQKQKIILAYLVVNIILLAVVGFFRLVQTTVKPVERLVAVTEAYDESNNFLFASSREGNEFGQLTASLNRMTQRIEKDRRQLRETVASLEAANLQLKKNQKEMVKTEKLAAVGRLSAGLAHEIGNPIGIIQGYLELLQKNSLTPDERQQFSERAISELSRINQLIRQLLDFARTSPAGRQKVNANDLLLAVIDLFRNQKKMENIRFATRLDAHRSTVETDEEGLRQVLLNILLNAVDAIRERGEDFPGEISIFTRNDPREDGPHNLIVTIKDNGCGIAQDNLENIFDPFFTTKEPGKGTGLGLSVSHSIIESAGGRIEVSSTPGTGSEVRIILPVAG